MLWKRIPCIEIIITKCKFSSNTMSPLDIKTQTTHTNVNNFVWAQHFKHSSALAWGHILRITTNTLLLLNTNICMASSEWARNCAASGQSGDSRALHSMRVAAPIPRRARVHACCLRKCILGSTGHFEFLLVEMSIYNIYTQYACLNCYITLKSYLTIIVSTAGRNSIEVNNNT